jgi:hypothetical protein
MSKVLLAFLAFVMAGVSYAEEGMETLDPELSSLILSFLPAGSGEILMIVFSAIAALNALSITLEKITRKTESDKDDKAVSKLRTGLGKVQKLLNFFIAK